MPDATDIPEGQPAVSARPPAPGPLRAALAAARVPLLFLLGGLLVLTGARLALVLWTRDRLGDAGGFLPLFAHGGRIDLALLCYLLAPAVLVLGLLPQGRLRHRVAALLLSLASVAVMFMELVTPGFLAEFDQRPDRLFFEYLAYPGEVFRMLGKSHAALLFGLPPLVFLLGALSWRYWSGRLSREPALPYRLRVLALLPLLPALLVGARGLDHRPINLSTARYSSNRLANELALNSTFSAAYAVYAQGQENDATRLYGSLPWPEVLARVRKYGGAADAAYGDPQIPTLRRSPGAPARRPPNLVILIEESLGAGYVGRLGGLPLTPNLDRLAQQGLWFTRMYATGTRTARGIEAIVAGFPPTPAPPILKLPRADRDFFTLGALLRRQGYATEFIYGGVANFDNMRGFFLGNGFDRVIEQLDFEAPAMLGSWGVSDEDWVRKAHQTFVAHGERPFFAVMLSTSNHDPFEFPAGRFTPHEQPLYTRHNAMQYADYAIGQFFDLARAAPYYENTVFVVVADHDARVYGAELVPVPHFRIPALILGPGVAAGSYDRLASQIDLGPTLLRLLGIPAEHPMIGRDLLAAGDVPGRALMQFDLQHGFRVGNRLVVHQPGLPARSFTLDEQDRARPAADDPELTRDALAHALWASQSYARRLYRLPADSAAAAHGG